MDWKCEKNLKRRGSIQGKQTWFLMGRVRCRDYKFYILVGNQCASEEKLNWDGVWSKTKLRLRPSRQRPPAPFVTVGRDGDVAPAMCAHRCAAHLCVRPLFTSTDSKGGDQETAGHRPLCHDQETPRAGVAPLRRAPQKHGHHGKEEGKPSRLPARPSYFLFPFFQRRTVGVAINPSSW